jgi:hypothetical protein
MSHLRASLSLATESPALRGQPGPLGICLEQGFFCVLGWIFLSWVGSILQIGG